MAHAVKTLCLVLSLQIMLSSLQLCVCITPPQVPCYFIFGDSLADNGNNNGLATRARVNYRPYGVDFPRGPTGRFTNGLTTADIIGQFLGATNILSFAISKGSQILKGVNYASGSAGIRDDSGNNLGTHVSLNRQLQNHQVTISRWNSIIGRKAARRLRKCLYTVGMGSNDYINNYFLPGSSLSRRLTPDQYANDLINQYSRQLRSLHNAGARKIALFGLGPIGCTPFAIRFAGQKGSCVANINFAVQLFNAKLKSLVDRLNRELVDSKFVYVNVFGISSSATKGLKVTNAGCCPINKIGLCKPNSVPCGDRSMYAFFDGFHPTEAVNRMTAGRSFRALNPSDAYPFDIGHLALEK